MLAISVDIENEFADIAEEAARLSNTLTGLDKRNFGPFSQEAWEVGHICASATEKIYTGCERVMARLAAVLDRSPIDHTDG